MIRSALCTLMLVLAGFPAPARDLRVCADPNNLPFSNRAEDGFENKIVALIAKDLGADVKYTWWAQRRGFVRNTLKAGDCDLWPGVAAEMQMLTATRPYYRSSYVFVTRAADGLDIHSFDDPRLRPLTVGVQMVGNDAMNTPPAHALARRGITQNVRGFMIYGDYSAPAPSASIVNALRDRSIDIAAVWGPIAGYYSAGRELQIVPADASPIDGASPMTFDIAMGVRKGDGALKQEIDTVLMRNKPAIDAILKQYHIPLIQDPVVRNAKASRP